MRQLVCILILTILGVHAEEPEKLVSGVPTSIEQYPHAVSIRINNNHFCGGSIISNYFIVTAGHCVAPLLQNANLRGGLTVVTGTTYLSSGGEAHKVARMWYHENYNPNTPGRDAGFDIGLLKLAAPITFNSRQRAIRLPTSDVVSNEGVTVVAWGSTGFRRPVHDNLQKLDARCMLWAECQRYHQNFMRIHPNEFCTLIATGIGTCNGDSGSGVVRYSDKTIMGVVSGGKPCALGDPDVYTNVAKFVPWINQKMSSY
ncbi:chymotrypsin-1-like [Cataglyphis hispanica]|uniref:chymotrypsin-1-like n=1 Tax=Cataglyphis hispanica TaxID=1086592 RepID=UPI0021802CED|nr:chymotrypsin-1-like [Cataglyphis hispanica]